MKGIKRIPWPGIFVVSAVLIVSSLMVPKGWSASVTLRQQGTSTPHPSAGMTLFTSARTLTFPTRSTPGGAWEAWIKSVASPASDNEVPQQTSGILLQVGYYVPVSDTKWTQIAFRYPTGTDWREMFLVNSHVAEVSPGYATAFKYYRAGWLPLLPGQNLEILKWDETDGTATSVLSPLFLGRVSGQSDPD